MRKEYAAGKRSTPMEIREGLASLGLRKCACGRQATRVHRKGKRIRVQCELCERNATIDHELAGLKKWRAGR